MASSKHPHVRSVNSGNDEDKRRASRSSRPDGKTVLDVLFGKDEAAYEQFIEHDVKVANEFAKKELEYHNALDSLAQNEVDPVEIVDEAIARLLEDKRGVRIAMGKRLQGLIVEVVHEFVRKLEERERREVSLEGNVKDPVEEAGFRTLGEHVLDFWQPDQDASIYEYIPDPDVPTPAEIKDMKDRQSAIYKALNDLPKQWREDFVLMAVSGWSLNDVAAWRDTSADEVKRGLAATQTFLKERLREQGELSNRKPRSLPHRHEHD